VGKATKAAILAAALALAAPLAAHSAGLGKLNVLSPLGQNLNAEIEIVALRPGEEDGLSARVAPADAFEAAGIEPTALLNTMRFAVERRGSQRILRVTTTQPVNEPFVELLVELQWASGRLVREYTFLLDPPEYKARDTFAAAQKAKPAAPAQPAAAAAAPPALVAPAPAAPAAPAAEPKPAPQAQAKPSEPVIAATPAPAAPAAAEPDKPAAEVEKPTPAAEAQPSAPAVEVVKEPAKEPEAARDVAKEPPGAPGEPKVYEVVKGDTLAKIAQDNLPAGVSLNQMLVAIYRANQDAFIRENVNWVRAGRILNIPSGDALGTIDAQEANRIVRQHMAEFRDYRSKLAAAPASAEATPGQRDGAGRIEPKPAAPAPAAPQDQVRLSKADPQKPSATARGDDLASRERALKEAQSRISDLEKNVSDLQKLLELKNQQLAELEKKAGAKPAPATPAPAPAAKPAAPAPAPAAPAPTPAAPAPTPAAKAPEAPKPAAEAPKPAAPAPAAPVPAAPAPAAKAPEAPKPAPKPAAQPAPVAEPSLIDEFLDNPVALAGLAGVVVLLLVYAAWAWRKKKTAQAKFTDSVIGAAAAGAAAGASISEPTLGGSTPAAPATASTQPAAAGAEEVDPIAEADVYMAYGRDAQAEEILKEALQKDSSRIPVHAKLLEIYAKRRDTKAFEQSAAKLKSLTNGAGPEWEKAAALGRSIDPSNGLYAGAAAAAPAAVAEIPAAPAPTLDFDIGGATQGVSPSAPDLALDAAPPSKLAADTGLDFDVSGANEKKDVSVEETVVAPAPKADAGLDFNLDLGTPAAAPERKPEPSAPAPAPAEDPGLTFDLNLDLGGDKKSEPSASPASADLSTISLDLGGTPAAPAAPSGTDPKWQEIATKLDLAKAYEEMGDKDGARELLNEVMKDGDAAQKGTAQQLLAKLG
jgi:pilus assembly protein FimV